MRAGNEKTIGEDGHHKMQEVDNKRVIHDTSRADHQAKNS